MRTIKGVIMLVLIVVIIVIIAIVSIRPRTTDQEEEE